MLAIEVGIGYLDLDLVAEIVFVAASSAAETEVLCVKLVLVVLEVAEWNEAFAFIVVDFDV